MARSVPGQPSSGGGRSARPAGGNYPGNNRTGSSSKTPPGGNSGQPSPGGAGSRSKPAGTPPARTSAPNPVGKSRK